MNFFHVLPGNIDFLVHIDVAFAVNNKKYCQMGILAMLPDKAYGTVKIIHYFLSKSKRVCKRIIAAELFPFIDRYDVSYIITHAQQEMVGRKAEFTLYTDSQSLYGPCILLAHIAEGRVKIDHVLNCEAYERREKSIIVWIQGKNSLVDSLTKIERRSDALMNVARTNHFLPTTGSGIERDGKKVQTSSGHNNSERDEQK